MDSGYRAPSKVVMSPQQMRDAWLSDYNTRRDVVSGTGVPAVSFQDNLNTQLGGIFNNLYGAPDQSTVPDADRSSLWGGLYNTAEAAFDPSTYNSTSDATISANPAYQDAFKTWAGQDAYDSIANFQPTAAIGPDFSKLDAEKKRMDQQFKDSLGQQQNIQSAYQTTLGGGTPGGVLPDPSAGTFGTSFGSLDGGTTANGDPTASATDGNFAPWNSLAYNPNGLGALGGYNPNPFNTAGPSNRAQSQWGGIFSNRNPFSLTSG